MSDTGISVPAAERRRVEAVVETLAAMHRQGENLGELAHDARNMVTALALYCDLLEEPGVLAPPHRHYGGELRLLAEASRSLVEKMSALEGRNGEGAALTPFVSSAQERLFPELPEARPASGASTMEPMTGGLIDDLAEELVAAQDLLRAIAGPSIRMHLHCDGGPWPVRMGSENLVRALVNLVKNAAQSIYGAGVIEVNLAEAHDRPAGARRVVLAIEDTGYGIPEDLLERIFEPGFTTRAGERQEGGWFADHRGLGLAITRSIVEAAGGRIHAENRTPRGARFVIELPVRTS